MDRADRFIDQDEAERNSFIQHHVVTGRGSLFPVQGDASRSKLDEVAINDVMVSYIVDNDVEGLETTRIIK
ncbi:uncharacterized protein J4E92_010165 [Alternaria infectoria]|uniref:uncharacterized protein n=1 Tax=Alternaria infectoria TaxID=45303 RepID=UPI0022209B34|nr:uncharacterized protein J4E92_010165 [Alternaria infectoria]KAI4912120.1 hypothetical protein J4E92_010165 [Alternaria infectoria]